MAERCIIRQEALRTTTISISWKRSVARSSQSQDVHPADTWVSDFQPQNVEKINFMTLSLTV